MFQCIVCCTHFKKNLSLKLPALVQPPLIRSVCLYSRKLSKGDLRRDDELMSMQMQNLVNNL